MNEQQLSQVQTEYEQGGPESPALPSLIETFYEHDNDDIFLNWYGDAVSDHEDDTLRNIKAHMRCIKVWRESVVNHGKRGAFLEALSAHEGVQRYYADFGRLMFEMIDDYMEKASERCK